ncbi:T3SS (YopN, CesT) and YbjN peptide-binding chaperone 1 [Hoyosella subflava]|uniref:TY-Chap central domain-containing protein n=1 Tax=Hoyosella subflava (strain DSM 45089 / JCM 17490 / NBRC 109087 / DQS3-9A1) TaxID=443218 RepID=F6EJ40_HOYSD|nr:YbjN domain-containing protein [Hoyosella subflava]AEF41272.1 hypothetical protein AS9A_2825 [Hoyosella subflava DQS3-9A1]
MSHERLRRQVEAILDSNGMSWVAHESGYSLRFASAIVHVLVTEWGRQTVIQIRSDVLRDVAAEPSVVVDEVNELNCETTFGRWAYYRNDRLIVLEYDLLADHLQEAELMVALVRLARWADSKDDALAEKLGGKRAIE